MADLFKEVLPSILQSKRSVLQDEEDIKKYDAYVINRALSYHMDCVLYANEINKYHYLDKDIQYQYYLNSLRSFKRPYSKWHKAESIDDLLCVKSYFGYSTKKAKEALRILTEEQLSEIRKKTDKGGVKK